MKNELGRNYRVGPLEGLWWADDMTEFWAERKADWQWTMMICQPDEVTLERFTLARDEAGSKRPLSAMPLARLERFEEGLSAQLLHVGPYSAEGLTIARLHPFIRELAGTFEGSPAEAP